MQLNKTYAVPLVSTLTLTEWNENPWGKTAHSVLFRLEVVKRFIETNIWVFEFSIDEVKISLQFTDEFIVSCPDFGKFLANHLADQFYYKSGKRISVDALMSLGLGVLEQEPFYKSYKGLDESDWVDTGWIDETKWHESELDAAVKQNAQAESNAYSLSEMSKELPGINEVVKYPCECHKSNYNPVRRIIIHLNDQVMWTREQIADWLDELADSGEINIDFEVDSGIGDDLEMEIRNAAGN